MASTGTSAGDGATVLFRSGGLEVGVLDCRADSALWREPTQVSRGYVVVYPTAPVLITRPRGSFLADRTRVVLHNDGDTYQRRLAAEEADDCLYLRLDRAEVLSALDSAGLRSSVRPGRELRAPYGPTDHATYVRQRVLRDELVGGSTGDPATTAGTVRDLLRRTLRAALAPTAPCAPLSRLAAAEDVRLAVAAPLDARMTIAEVAERVGYSPFHLARLFRTVTGTTIQEHRRRLRLRAALDRLVGGERDLSALAGDLGFATHSHFSERFRAEFGMTPGDFRRTRHLPTAEW